MNQFLDLTDEKLVIFQSWSKHMVRYGLKAKIGRAWLSSKGGIAYQIGCFLFLAGEVDDRLLPSQLAYLILISEQENWQAYLKEQNQFIGFTRYAFDLPNQQTLNTCQSILNNLSGNYQLESLSAPSFIECQKQEWSADLQGVFTSFSDFKKQGALGFVIYKDRQLVGGVSSAFVYQQALEVEIAVHPEFQRQGLAKILGAKLIIEGFKKGRLPLWDAHNLASYKVAIALGYRCLESYSAFEISNTWDN
ncbi:GNAT family N-acetyltransferase [Enterococcus columbae]|uniref:N-acetyltransferase domain-containing protein n=1 Tax=Enterococcus columbae DSM 7374 = ATCC 51263 TaxID=1121865 RepID=S1N5R0_9ENTE|nr:GNAT family N-acetyltransferase [Enterococcus columbae]EOT44154.1 hypothetical protein OMW_00208 [Enterococcus columbae DSM 7374 = ATCC 51263]EOW84312.1 hypothetical protein I568_00806 [Enterococcus columbae DSM 7374 = ATCC 51263]